MALDLAALKAKIAAQKAAAPATTQINNNATANITPSISVPPSTGNTAAVSQQSQGVSAANEPVVPTVNAPDKLGTSKTSEIDHLDFIAKMNSLSEAIYKQHPTMPVLLMQIHKQLRADPELVTTLDEDAIGIVVKGLQVQTKTELVVAATSTKGTKKKGAAVSVDML